MDNRSRDKKGGMCSYFLASFSVSTIVSTKKSLTLASFSSCFKKLTIPLLFTSSVRSAIFLLYRPAKCTICYNGHKSNKRRTVSLENICVSCPQIKKMKQSEHSPLEATSVLFLNPSLQNTNNTLRK